MQMKEKNSSDSSGKNHKGFPQNKCLKFLSERKLFFLLFHAKHAKLKKVFEGKNLPSEQIHCLLFQRLVFFQCWKFLWDQDGRS